MKKDRTFLALTLDPDVYELLKADAETNGYPMTYIIREMLKRRYKVKKEGQRG